MKIPSQLSNFLLLILVLYFLACDRFPRATGRFLQTGSSDGRHELISDGMTTIKNGKENRWWSDHSVIRMNGTSDSDEPFVCEQMYGFLPCSKNIPGHIFLILVYEYLLFHGEYYVAAGGERIFKILGPGVFGACAFQLIGSLPEALILLASGVLGSREVAQECLLTGVGLVAGTSILLLTLVWGTCVLLSSQPFSDYLQGDDPSSCPDYTRNPFEKIFLSLWPGYGTVTDTWASYMAHIMLLSVIPFIIIQIPKALHLSLLWHRIFIVIALVVSAIFLLSYLFYQLFQPWIQRRQLLYLKHRHLVVDMINHMERHTMEQLFTDDGSPNLSVLRRIFEEADQDGDNSITTSEVKEFLREIKFQRLYSDKDNVAEDIIQDFDLNNDKRITLDEFVKGMEKWLEQTRKDSGQKYQLDEVLRPWMEKKREEREMMKNLIPEILELLRASTYGSLLTENGSPDVPAIQRLFKEIDQDRDNVISSSELKELLTNIKFGITPQDTDAAASELMEQLDISGDHLANEDEFVSGLSKWLNTTSVNQPVLEEKKESEYQTRWEETDKLVEEKFVDKSFFARVKAISLVLLGVAMLGVLAEPLIHSVQNLSEAANIPSFFIAFVFVPFASNARIAISAIGEARRKKLKINSLTFSELYGTVLMNNLLGFLVLLSLVFFRDLTWVFSVEVLMVLIVSVVMGCLASFSTVFPVWTALLAYLLYPLSLVLVTLLGDFNWLS